MALHVRHEIMLKYSDFYKLAAGERESALLLTGLTDETAAALCDFSADEIIVTDSPLLSQLNFLERFTCAKAIAILRCKSCKALWNMSENRELHAIAIADCKAMCNIEALRFGGDLEHFYLNNIWAFSKIKSLEPLKAHTGLKTVDLACKTERGAGSIDFNEAWPELEALTISPNLRRNFITASEVRR